MFVQQRLEQLRQAQPQPFTFLDEEDDPAFEILADSRKILRDKTRYTVPFILMDADPDQRASLAYRSEQGLLSDSEARALADQAREAEMCRISNAWKGGQTILPEPVSLGDARADAEAAFEAESKRRSEAWKASTW